MIYVLRAMRGINVEKKKLPLLLGANLLIITIIGYIDYLTSSSIKIIAFYLIPILFVTYYGNVAWGIFFSVLSIFFSMYVDYSGYASVNKNSIINNIMLSIVYLIIVYLVNILRNNNELIKQNLNEKEIILRDIHHRMKNQMSSLLAIINTAGNEDIEKTSIDLSGRIHTYLHLYEYLSYDSLSQTRIIVRNYIEEITKHIVKSMGTTVIPVSIIVNDGNFEIDNKQMVAIGLIINELVTNSLKYAFIESRQGSITIDIARHEDSRLELVYRDSGRGFDFKAERTKRKFGLELVAIQTSQLNGSMHYSANHGSEYTFIFHAIPMYNTK